MGERSVGVEEMYVNYLPVPRGVRRWVRVAVPTVLWVMALVGAAVSWTQGGGGEGRWETGKPVEVVGVLDVSPYPMVVGDGWGVLLVEVGKRGVGVDGGVGGGRDVSAMAGRMVRASGWVIERDGRRMLELEPGDAGLGLMEGAAVGAAVAGAGAWREVGVVTLRGEIVDSKCWSGAMRPGEGRTHKGCAVLCVRGGIPPVLVTPRGGGRSEWTVLCGADGGRLGEEYWGLIAEPVEVTGVLEVMGGLRRMRVSAAALRGR